jgi:hypothetical protein
MLYKKLQRFGREKNWYRTQNSIFGIHKGYLFNIYQGNFMSSPQFKHIVCQTEPIADAEVVELRQLFEANKKSIKYDVAEVGHDFVSITFYENWSFTKATKLDETLDFMAKELSERAIKSTISSENNLNHYDMSGRGVVLTQQAFIKQKSELEQAETLDKLNERGYLHGFIGSLVYSLPMIILWALLAYYLERLSTGLGVIIALVGNLGYEKFRGKFGFWTKWLLVLSNIMVIFLASIASTVFMLWQADVPFDQMLNLYNFNVELQKMVHTNLFISMLMGVIGWLWIVLNVETKKNYMEEARKL